MKKMIFTLLATTMLAVTGLAQKPNFEQMDVRNDSKLEEIVSLGAKVINTYVKHQVTNVTFTLSNGKIVYTKADTKTWSTAEDWADKGLIAELAFRANDLLVPEQIVSATIEFRDNKSITQKMSKKDSDDIKRVVKHCIDADNESATLVEFTKLLVAKLSDTDIKRLKAGASQLWDILVVNLSKHE
jgi:hypothetical protein